MAPQKRKTVSKVDPIKSRCKLVKHAIEHAETSQSIKDLLCSTISVTIGSYANDRHAFNQRFVSMIGDVLAAEQARLNKDLANKEVAFAELTPAQATREAAVVAAKADTEAKAAAVDAAQHAVKEIGATLKEANHALKEAQKAEKTGNADLEAIAAKKASLVGAQTDSLGPLLDGTAGDGKKKMAKTVLNVGKEFHFDSSLLATAEPVILKEVADRGSFDATCVEQLQAAFAAAIHNLDEQLDAGSPGKAERAAVVSNAAAAKQAAEASQADLKEKAHTAKDAEHAAHVADHAADQSLEHFLPDLKKCGDALDKAKEDLQHFNEGALQAYNELKNAKEEDFKEEEPPASPAKAARVDPEAPPAADAA